MTVGTDMPRFNFHPIRWIRERFAKRRQPEPAQEAAPYKLEPPKTPLNELRQRIDIHAQKIAAARFSPTRNMARAQAIIRNQTPGKPLRGEAGSIIGAAIAELLSAREPRELQYQHALENEKDAAAHVYQSVHFRLSDQGQAQETLSRAQENVIYLRKELNKIDFILRDLQT